MKHKCMVLFTLIFGGQGGVECSHALGAQRHRSRNGTSARVVQPAAMRTQCPRGGARERERWVPWT